MSDIKTFDKFYDPIRIRKNALDVHQRQLRNWSKEMTTSRESTRNTLNLYVDLNLKYKNTSLRGIDILKLKKNILILGIAGSGKTTLIKMLINQLLNNTQELSGFPILIKGRDISNKESLWSELSSILGLSSDSKNKRYIIDFINENKLYVFIDGIDEIQFSKKRKLTRDLDYLYSHISEGMIISTSRYMSLIDTFNAELLEILPLSQDQLGKFAQNFVGKDTDFIEELKSTPFYKLAQNPLILSMLLIFYTRVEKLPSNPSELFKKLIYLLLEEWDMIRGINRQPTYKALPESKMLSLLMRLAYDLSIEKKYIFTETEFDNLIKSIKESFDISDFDSKLLLREIKSTSGIITQRDKNTYSFAHLALQEYLAAEHVVRFPFIDKKLIEIYPEIQAIAVKLSSNEPQYLKYLLEEIDTHLLLESVFQKFISRLAFESVNFNESNLKKALLEYIKSSKLTQKEKNIVKGYITIQSK